MLHLDAKVFEADEHEYEEATQLFYQSLGCANVEKEPGEHTDGNIVMFKFDGGYGGPLVSCVEEVTDIVYQFFYQHPGQ